MTRMSKMEIKCAVCGKQSNQPVILSSNKFGYQDLDTRPPEMYRSTMAMWVLECPYCGYVANSIDEDLEINQEYLKSDRYKKCDNINFKSELSKRFYKEYLIESEKVDDIGAFFAMLHCAWACDDAEDLENSKYTRQIAIKIANEIIKSDKDNVDNIIVIKSDLLRRIGEFDKVIEEYENLTMDNEFLNQIIKYEVEKAREKDDNCYTIEEVHKPD